MATITRPRWARDGIRKPGKIYPPAWMLKSAQEEYRRVLPLLIERRTFTEADLTTFEAYCLAVGVMRDAKTVSVQFAAMAKARSLAIELGLTPLSRSKAKRAEDVENDLDLADLDL